MRRPTSLTLNLRLKKLYLGLVLILPPILLFSYQPRIVLGNSDTMNFELSLPLIWLALFGIFSVLLFVKEKKVPEILKKWYLFSFPLFLTISVFWSPNFTRGILTAGILWLIYVAGLSFYFFRNWFDKKFWRNFWLVILGTGIFVVSVLILQCILDLLGVPREQTLMCAGCVTEMFGFPHPNGLAIEPQFMGNLLLLPVLASVYFYYQAEKLDASLLVYNQKACFFSKICFDAKWRRRVLLATFCFLAGGVFLTFSRGAIYAMLIGLAVFGVWEKKLWKKTLKVVAATILTFGVVLNFQGLMAEIGPTSDTYQIAISKVLNQLTLGVVDLRVKDGTDVDETKQPGGKKLVEKSDENVEKVVENSGKAAENFRKAAIFDGYVTESTDTRVRLNDAALEVWSSDFKNILFGVGLGGAGVALYEHGLTSAPKEIVQNQYFSLLLETGLVGMVLLGLVLGSLIRVLRSIKNRSRVGFLVTLLVSFAVSLMFFSGLPNALQIYLTPSLLLVWAKPKFD